MSLDDRMLLPDDPSNNQALALTQITTMSQPAAPWRQSSSNDQSGPKSPVDMAACLHAFRRHWVLASWSGLVLSVVAGLSIWFGMGNRYTASALIHLDYVQKGILGQTERPNAEEYEIFKNTQLQLLLSRWVLEPALRDKDINRLPILREQQEKGDPVAWLSKNISATFPLKGEHMEVSLTTKDPMEASKIVQAVVSAYMTKVDDSEKGQLRDRLSELDRLFNEKTLAVRNTRENLKHQAEVLGTAETENLKLKQKLTLEELGMYRQELARNSAEVGKLRSEKASRTAELQAVEGMKVSDLECEMFAQSDSKLKALSDAIQYMEMSTKSQGSVLVPGASKAGRVVDKYATELERYQEDRAKRLDEIREEIKRRRQADVEREIKRVDAEIEIADKQMDDNEKMVASLKLQAEKFGNSTIEVEMMRTDLQTLERTFEKISTERDALYVEQRQKSRITRLGDKVDPPKLPSNLTLRVALTVLASLVGFGVPLTGVMLWDLRLQRVNTPNEISDRMGIPVIGSLPVIPPRVLRQLGSPSKRNQLWQLRMTESVDGITARLLRRAELEQRRVVMITSAVSGEGKTTLTAQLAMSLARAGRRTVLLDFDLRQPTFDEAFGLARSPGICEILRDEAELGSSIQATATPNLSVVTAGNWNRLALSALANGAASSLFKELRDDFEFVVVDTSPILPIADTRFVSQYVDSVVLCVLRDISEAPRIRAACEILEAFGVSSVEAAVTGPSESDSKRTAQYSSNVSA
jgi:capsular exopolysaccharide synthesis family protein